MKKAALTVLALGMFAAVAMAEDMVDNPLYKQWAAQKVGALTKHQMTTVTDPGGKEMTTKMTMTTTLKELTSDKAVLEIVSEMEMEGQKVAMPAQKQEVPAKVAKSAASQPAAPTGVKVTKKGEGDEEITVGGKTYKCHWVEYQMSSDQMESTSKSWTTDKVPGIVKSVTESTKPMKMKSTMELSEFKAGS